jgi:hypothetical protein
VVANPNLVVGDPILLVGNPNLLVGNRICWSEIVIYWSEIGICCSEIKLVGNNFGLKSCLLVGNGFDVHDSTMKWLSNDLFCHFTRNPLISRRT